MRRISFKTSAEDSALIVQVANRASHLGMTTTKIQLLDLIMDLTACHANGNPLRLAELLAADEASFREDVGGIRANIERVLGTLKGGFVPHYSMQSAN